MSLVCLDSVFCDFSGSQIPSGKTLIPPYYIAFLHLTKITPKLVKNTIRRKM